MFESTVVCGRIALGIQGEHHARKVSFIETGLWRERFGEGTFELLHQRSSDEAPYPVVMTIEDGVPYWYVTNADTAIAGIGKCELRYIVDDVVIKSCSFLTDVMPSLGEGTEEAPEPQKAWVDQVFEAAHDVEEAVAHCPIIGDNGNWLIWDADEGEYVDSGVSSGGDVPTKVSQLENDVGYITAKDIPSVNVPTKLSDLEADSISRSDQEPFDFSAYIANFAGHESEFSFDNLTFKNMGYGNGVSFDGNVIHDVGAPTDDTDGANKKYVDDAVKNVGGGVTSWNDLEDKPFGDLETYVQKFLYKKSSLAVGTYTTTFIPSVPYSIESGGKYKVIVVGTGSNYRVEREYVATSVSSALVFLGSNSDDVYLSCLTADSQYTITVKNLSASMGIEVYLYAFEKAPVPLDEKYIPETIARKTDIPTVTPYEIPFFDLEAMGMDTHEIGVDETVLYCDTTEIREAMRKGIVGFKIPTTMGSATVYGTLLELETTDIPQMVCSFCLEGNVGNVFVSVDEDEVIVYSVLSSGGGSTTDIPITSDDYSVTIDGKDFLTISSEDSMSLSTRNNLSLYSETDINIDAMNVCVNGEIIASQKYVDDAIAALKKLLNL